MSLSRAHRSKPTRNPRAVKRARKVQVSITLDAGLLEKGKDLARNEQRSFSGWIAARIAQASVNGFPNIGLVPAETTNGVI